MEDSCTVNKLGSLLEGLTPEMLLEPHSSHPRNKNIAYAFFKAGFIESWGRGYIKIREGFESAGLPMPKIEVVEDGVKVTFQRNNVNASQSSTDFVKDFIKDFIKDFTKENQAKLSERQKDMLTILAEDNYVTSQKIAQMTGVSQRTVMKDLTFLQSIGIISREGGRKEGHWVILASG